MVESLGFESRRFLFRIHYFCILLHIIIIIIDNRPDNIGHV